MKISKDYTEVHIRLVVRGDISQPQLQEPITQLGRIAEYRWDVEYLSVFEEDLKRWKELYDEDDEDLFGDEPEVANG